MPSPQRSASIPTPLILVVMGISGAGKTTLALALAGRLGWPFQEGDDLHPPSNIARMRAGTALTDQDREPWLAAIARWIGQQLDAGRSGIVSCSALRRSYRDRLRAEARQALRFVFLDVPETLAHARLQGRSGHFMPATLVHSQSQTLERPDGEADCLSLSADQTVDALCDQVCGWLGPAAQNCIRS